MTPDERRHALVVAVSDYRDAKLRELRAPAADAERLAAVLQNPQIGGFAVDVALNESETQLRRRIARFFTDRRPDDLLLIHFACHGVKDERGELHLTASDTELGPMLGATAIASSWLNDQMTHSRSQRIVMLLDCCFSGSFPFGTRHRSGEDVNVQAHFQGRGRVVITASNAMEYAYEGDRLSGAAQPSYFTDAIVEALETGRADRDRDRLISVDELYDYVYDRVKERAPDQTPQIMGQLAGPLYIARTVHGTPLDPARLDDAPIAPSPVAESRPLPPPPPRQTATWPPVRPAPPPVTTRPARPAPPPAPPPRRIPAAAAVPSWQTRASASLIDFLIVGPVGLVLAAIAWSPWAGGHAPGGIAVLSWVSALVIGGVAYGLLLWRFGRRRSLGKWICALRVVRLDGAAPTRRQLVTREGVKWTLVALSTLTLGVLLAGTRLLAHRRSDRRFLHDVLAGTTVIQEPRGALSGDWLG